MAVRPRRSALYMPGSNARALEKAKTLAADVVIFDLEDAVAPEAKEAAREQVVAAVASGGYGDRELVIRINGLDTPWGEEDLTKAGAAAPNAILVPKVSTAAQLFEVGQRLTSAPEAIQVWAMIETPLAILNVREIAAAAQDRSTRLACFVLGTNDLAKETRADLGDNRTAALTGYLLRSQQLAPTASTCSTVFTMPSGTSRASAANVSRAASSAWMAKHSFTRTRSGQPTKFFRQLQKRSSGRAKFLPRSTSQKTGVRAPSALTAGWSSYCMPRWLGALSSSPRQSPRVNGPELNRKTEP